MPGESEGGCGIDGQASRQACIVICDWGSRGGNRGLAGLQFEVRVGVAQGNELAGGLKIEMDGGGGGEMRGAAVGGTSARGRATPILKSNDFGRGGLGPRSRRGHGSRKGICKNLCAIAGQVRRQMWKPSRDALLVAPFACIRNQRGRMRERILRPGGSHKRIVPVDAKRR